MICKDILRSFESNRKDKGEPFEEDSFMEFLVSDSKRIKGVHNSFEGKRRFFGFWKEVQLEQGVCFSLKDQEKKYSLDKFVERIEELKANPKSSKAALRHQMRYGFEWNISVFMNLPILCAFIFTMKWVPISGVILLVAIYANYKHLSFHFREKKYEKQLWEKLTTM